MTTNSAGYAGESPETRPESIDDQVKRKGVRPVESVKDMAQDGVFESDEELEQFLPHEARINGPQDPRPGIVGSGLSAARPVDDFQAGHLVEADTPATCRRVR